MSYSIDFLAVGDVVTDAFIELLPQEAEIEHDKNKHPLLCMTYGTKIPFKEAIIVSGVGNAPNAAVNFSKLGLNSSLYANIGDDLVGRDILRSLKSHKVSTEFVEVQDNKKSNYHYVLWYKDDRTILIKHEDYKYKWPTIRDHQTPKWIYLSSVGESGSNIHKDLDNYLSSHKDTKLAFQPGTFQIKEGVNKLKSLYQKTSIFVANKEEYQQILASKDSNEKTLLSQMLKLGPKIALLTDGPKGAYASDGKSYYFMPPYPDPKPPVDRTGAGDSYASTFSAAIASGKSIADALAWAGVTSMNVVQLVGAQAGLLSSSEIIELLKKAPTHYKAKMI